jgi:hypothetical protein
MGGATLASFFNGSVGGAGAGVYDYSEPGTGSVVIPTGATGVTIQVWGGGGGGATGYEIFLAPGEPDIIDGGGGGGGGYAKTVLILSGQDGKTILYTVGAGGAGAGSATAGGFSNAYSGTYTLATMTANGGQPGSADPLQTQGAGGTATGGNTTNTTGNGGAAYTSFGAAGIVGDGSLTAGGGGNGSFLGGRPGQSGRVRLVFTF